MHSITNSSKQVTQIEIKKQNKNQKYLHKTLFYIKTEKINSNHKIIYKSKTSHKEEREIKKDSEKDKVIMKKERDIDIERQGDIKISVNYR